MIRRLTSVLLLTTLVTMLAGPLAAGGQVCRMERSAPASLCASCDIAPAPNRAATVSAGSCCRFEAAPSTSSLPGVVTPVQGAHQDRGTALAPAPGFDHCAGASAEQASLAPNPASRSTDSPVARNTNLRL